MGIHRLNHAVLYVRDVEISTDFYTRLLGFEVVMEVPGGAFMRASGSTNDHDLAVFAIGEQAGPSGAGRTTVGMYHLAWEVDTLGDLASLRESLHASGALVGSADHGTTKSLYAKDPDGLEFEVVWLIPASSVTDEDRIAAASIGPLDLDAELERFGTALPGGVGVSR